MQCIGSKKCSCSACLEVTLNGSEFQLLYAHSFVYLHTFQNCFCLQTPEDRLAATQLLQVDAARGAAWEAFTADKIWDKVCKVIIVCDDAPDLFYAGMNLDLCKDTPLLQVVCLEDPHAFGA